MVLMIFRPQGLLPARWPRRTAEPAETDAKPVERGAAGD
jgi:hypothetical protein